MSTELNNNWPKLDLSENGRVLTIEKKFQEQLSLNRQEALALLQDLPGMIAKMPVNLSPEVAQ